MRIIKRIILILLSVAAAVLLTGFVIPVRLEVEVNPEKLYQYDSLTRDDVTVYLSPLFKRGKQITDFRFTKESSAEYDDITIQQTIFYKKEHIRNVKLDRIKAVYEGTPHEGDAFDVSDIHVEALFKDGSTQEISDFTILNKSETLDLSSNMVIKTKWGSARLEIPFQSLKELKAEYDVPVYEGDDFDSEHVKVSVLYEDGTGIPVDNFEIEGEDVIRGNTKYAVYTSYGECSLEIEPITIRYATPEKEYSSGMVFDGNIKLTYTDGTEKIVEDAEYEPVELEYGVNEIPFKWKGINGTLFIAATATTPVSIAESTLTDEIAASIYNDLSNDFYMTIRKTEEPEMYITHIVLNNPSQIGVESANGEYGSGLEAPEKAAKRTGWIIGANGSFFDAFTSQPVNPSCIIRNNRIITAGTTTGYEICLTNDGSLFSPPAGIQAEDLIAMGVKDILISTDPLLIQGNALGEGSTTVGGQFQRTAIGMVTPGEYYIVNGFLTYADLQSVFISLGCQYARPLDGGASSVLYYKDQLVTGTGRPMTDFICFRKGE